MSAAILDFVSDEAVSRAWEDYAALARQAQADTRLLTDLDFHSRMALAKARWERLFLARERGGR